MFWRKVVKRRTARWAHGLVGAFISGGMTVGTTQGGLGLGYAMGMGTELLDIKQMGLVFLGSGMGGAILYLKQSPLPSIKRELTPDDDVHIHPHVPGDPLQFIQKPKPTDET